LIYKNFDPELLLDHLHLKLNLLQNYKHNLNLKNMKNLILVIILTFSVKQFYAQNSLNILEEAYLYFDQGEYKKAEKSFIKYFELTEGSKDDYYFMAASLSASRKTEEALHYAEKAYKGIETLGIMSEDPLFEPIHNDILRKYNEIKEFYTFFNFEFRKGRKIPLKKIDSLYSKLELKKISAYDLLSIADKFHYKDSVKASYYFKEAILNGPEYLSRKAAYSFAGYMRADLVKWNDARKYKTINWSNYSKEELDSLISVQEDWMNQQPEALVKRDFLINLAYGYSLSKNYEKAGNLIVKVINKSVVFEDDIQHLLFQNDYLKPFFITEQGQNTLKYFISKYYENTFINADVLFNGVFQEESTSKRIIYEYLKAKNFNQRCRNRLKPLKMRIKYLT